jgi:hypothetical protein
MQRILTELPPNFPILSLKDASFTHQFPVLILCGGKAPSLPVRKQGYLGRPTDQGNVSARTGHRQLCSTGLRIGIPARSAALQPQSPLHAQLSSHLPTQPFLHRLYLAKPLLVSASAALQRSCPSRQRTVTGLRSAGGPPATASWSAGAPHPSPCSPPSVLFPPPYLSLPLSLSTLPVQ